MNVGFDGILGPASPSLQNCIKFSSSGRFFSALCDFGVVCICELTGKLRVFSFSFTHEL